MDAPMNKSNIFDNDANVKDINLGCLPNSKFYREEVLVDLAQQNGF